MFEKKWEEQCLAAQGIAVRFGQHTALDYILGEKLYAHAQAAAGNVAFRNELPRFVARVREHFSQEDIAQYFEALEVDAGVASQGREERQLESSGLLMSVKEKKERLARLAHLKDLLLSEGLGIG